jgi:hypothetical protein
MRRAFRSGVICKVDLSGAGQLKTNKLDKKTHWICTAEQVEEYEMRRSTG